MIYHYTKSTSLSSILDQGLRPICSGAPLAPGEKPVIWFSTNPIWEKTVFAMFAPTLKQAHSAARYERILLARIGCGESVAPHRWAEIKDVAGMPFKISQHLYNSAIRIGARPGEWRGSLHTVPPREFSVVQVFNGEAWVDYDSRAVGRPRAEHESCIKMI